MFKILASLCLFLVLDCKATSEEISNLTIKAGSLPPPPSWQPQAQLLQQDVLAVNALLRLNVSGKFVQSISATDCFSKTNSSILRCNCTSICRVTELYLNDSGLSGPMPSEIGYLDQLTSLDLSQNQLWGPIPDSFQNLSWLSEINLSKNNLSGPIPESFRNLSRLSELYLYSNNLEGSIPYFLGEMKLLDTLDLSENKLSGPIPESFRNMSRLSEIDLSENKLSGPIPDSFRNLSRLSELSLYSNNLEGAIPYFLCEMKLLETLVLDDNFLYKGIPVELGNISSLKLLSLTDNEFSGQLPQQLGNLTNLQELYLENNLFSGVLPSLEKLTNLSVFSIRGNNFSGRIPDFISKWPNLGGLGLTGNNFEAPIPDAIFNLTNLVYLSISDLVGAGKNHFFPEIPNIKSLVHLSLRNCSLTGPIPSNFWQSKTIHYVDLSFNNLVGGIPSVMHSPNLEYLFLKSNRLNGSIPLWMKDLLHVDVSENFFTNLTIPRTAISTQINVFSCCSNIKNEDMKWLEANYSCANDSSTREHLYINCGGNAITVNGTGNESTHYEADLEKTGASTFYLSSNKAWGFSSMGRYDTTQNEVYILESTSSICTAENQNLYMNARVSPISLKYYGFCLKKNLYTVKLHFAEIGWNTTYPRIKSNRVFDVEIQGEKKLTDFNIEEAAKGVNQEFTPTFDIHIENRLEIHLYWSGKGSVGTRIDDHYGPLISAISVYPVPASKNHLKLSSASIAGIVASSVLAVLIILALFWKLGRKTKRNTEQKGIELFPGVLYNFRQIKAATNSFDLKNKIGEGGFGNVYKGVLPNGTRVAVKKLSAKSKQGAKEYINEIGTSYALQHPNLVRLLGCCAEKSELLIVYEYMENNSLDHALFDSAEVKSKLNWLIRVQICRDIAKGLGFIHEESSLKIVHRDIKPTNILLDKDFTAKISDFGFAKHSEEENPRMITQLAGTTGYMAPEYMQGFLTPKADVYSFGLVMLEIVSGKHISTFRARDQNIYLLDIAYDYQRQGNLIALIDPSLGSDYTHKEAVKLLDLAMECVSPAPKHRPSMSEVVKVLEGIVKVVKAKWKAKTPSTGNPSSVETPSTGNPSSVDDSQMADPHFALSHSTQSDGSTSQEAASDTIVCSSTSKEIVNSSNLDV